MSNWIFYLIVGILAVIVGAVAVVNPQIAGLSITALVAISFIVLGGATVFLAFSSSGWGIFWSIVLGILMIAVGILMFKNPLASFATVDVLVAILMIASGITMIVAAFSADLGSGKWWAVIGGIASFILAYFLFTDPNMLGILVGVQLIFDGFGLVAFAFGVRKAGSIYL